MGKTLLKNHVKIPHYLRKKILGPTLGLQQQPKV